MANKLNKELQEQINLRKELLELSYKEQSAIDESSSTLQSRTDILQKIVSASEGALSAEEKSAQYASIRSDLEDQIQHYKGIGHSVQANSYALELEVLKTKENQLEAQSNVNGALKEAGDSLLGGMITKGEQLAETMKKPGGMLVIGLAAAVALLLTFSKTTDKIGEKFGALGVKNLSQELREANVTAVGLGRSIDDVGDSLQTLADTFGVVTQNSKDLLNSITETSVAIGMSNTEGAQLFGTLKSIVGLSDQQAENLAKQTALLADQEGLIPSTIMKDVANSSEDVAKFTKDGGKNIMRAAIEARKLGLNLSQAAGMAEGLLDFETSIEKTMEASLLIGRNINLDKARQLSLAGDMGGALKEMLKQVGSEAKFNKLNVLQRQSLAEALNTDVASLTKMVQLQGKSTNEMAKLTDMKVEELVAEDAISNMSMLNNTIKKISANIQSAIGGFLQFMGITAESSTGSDILKLALMAVGAGLIFVGVSALASAMKIKIMSKILGKSGKGLAEFAMTGSAAIPLLLTIAGVGLALAAVIAAVGFAFKNIGEGIKFAMEGFSSLTKVAGDLIVQLGENLTFGMILKIGALALALTGLAAALMLVGVAGVLALPALLSLSMFGLLPGSPGSDTKTAGATSDNVEDTRPKPVVDELLEAKVVTLQQEVTGLRDDMRKYFGVGGEVYAGIELAHQRALENFS